MKRTHHLNTLLGASEGGLCLHLTNKYARGQLHPSPHPSR